LYTCFLYFLFCLFVGSFLLVILISHLVVFLFVVFSSLFVCLFPEFSSLSSCYVYLILLSIRHQVMRLSLLSRLSLWFNYRR
jgi:hypothetical protein